uniref:Uncharacterized protein n=1 Tax=Romanomermis culicivorax TaxID=13658 RepID=A0A915I413_ROMCU
MKISFHQQNMNQMMQF